jgi:hypothetical protein
MKLSYFVPGFSSLILQICVVGGACVVGFSIDAGFPRMQRTERAPMHINGVDFLSKVGRKLLLFS